jgi:GNAT superfamily N-acetyltransferase
MPAPDSLIPIGLSLVKLASVTCAAAFMSDPYTEYVIPKQSNQANLKYGFEYYLRMSLLQNRGAYTTSAKCEGVAIWNDSRKKDALWPVFRINPLLPFRCGWQYVFRESSSNRLAEKIKRRYAPKHHMYLALLAVHPDSQGKGFTSQLLRPMLTKLDQDHFPCYLETQNLKNVSMYAHFGFKLVYEIILPRAGLPLYAMLRE